MCIFVCVCVCLSPAETYSATLPDSTSFLPSPGWAGSMKASVAPAPVAAEFPETDLFSQLVPAVRLGFRSPWKKSGFPSSLWSSFHLWVCLSTVPLV